MRATEGGYNENAVWLPGQRSIAYTNGTDAVVVARLDGGAPPVRIGGSDVQPEPIDVSPDGAFIVTRLGGDVRAIAVAAPHTSTALSTDPGEEGAARFAPDGRWLALSVRDARRVETTHLSRFLVEGGTPRLGPERILLSPGGGAPIGWRRDGREFYYVSPSFDVMAVSVHLQADTATIGPPVRLFRVPDARPDEPPSVTGDGTRFLATTRPFGRGQTIRVLTNWQARLP